MTREESGLANPWRIAGWGLAGALLLLPLVAMQFTREVDWTPADFVFAAVMIGGTGLAIEFAVRRSRDLAYRTGFLLLAGTVFLLVWINAAVGIIGDEGNPLNLLYAGVIGVALGGAAIVRFRAGGMARAMRVAAVAQGVVGGVAFFAGRDSPPGMVGQIVLNGVFVVAFALAAWLFSRAARTAIR